MNIYQYINAHVQASPDLPALVELSDNESHRITYQEFDRSVKALASYLIECGIERQDRVIVMVPMQIELYVAICAVIRIGAVAVFIDPHMPREEFEHCCDQVAAKAYISSRKGQLLRLLNASLRRIKCHITTDWMPGFLAKPMQSILQQGVVNDLPELNCAEDEPALVGFTTGSSGKPKGSIRTHKFLNAQIEALYQPSEKRAARIDVPGFAVLPLDNLIRGRTTLLPPIVPGKVAEINADIVISQVLARQPDMMSGSPAYLDKICRAALASGITLPSINILFSGGAPISKTQLQQMKQVWTNARIMMVYGSTEAEPVSRIDADEFIEQCHPLTEQGAGLCVGYPIEQIEARIIDIEMKSATVGSVDAIALANYSVGEIVVKGAHVNTQYWSGNVDQKRNKIQADDGIWHRMGDAGYIDDLGRLWLVGRCHTAMPSPWSAELTPAGLFDYQRAPWIFSYQVELVINMLPFVKQSAYVRHNNQFYLLIESRASQLTAEEQRACIREAIGNFPLDTIVFEKLPVDARHNSKINYTEVKAKLEASA